MRLKIKKIARFDIIFFFWVVLFLAPFLFSTQAYAATLTPGALFTVCGNISAAGTYYLNANIGTSGATCINITSAGAIIYSTSTHYISGTIAATSTISSTNGYSFSLSGAVVMTATSTINATGGAGGAMGTTTFNNTTQNLSTITGNAIFNDTTVNDGSISGNATFNSSAYNSGTYAWAVQTNSPSGAQWQTITSSSNGADLLAAVEEGDIYASTNYGVTWTARTAPGSQFWISSASSADGTKLAVETLSETYLLHRIKPLPRLHSLPPPRR